VLFHTPQFALFLVAVVALFVAVPARFTLGLLVVASLFFYGYFSPTYLALFVAVAVVDYYLALWGRQREGKRLPVILSALLNFGLLAYFKYTNFALENVRQALAAIGAGAPSWTLEVLLPAGISFFVFQIFTYTVEVIHRRIEPCRNIPELLLYKFWFPQFVAGPIERPAHLIPQLRLIPSGRDGLADRFPVAAQLFAEGWLRKAFADLLAVQSNAFFNAPASATSAEALFGVIAFGLQIYGDFSGYTRMAQGVSWLFGVRLMENFDRPYLARDPREFWGRWHISLSSWFRDYVYIPLGGNRRGVARTCLNLLVTFLISGLWHGAAWTFVLWGGLHGLLLIGMQLVGRAWDRVPRLIAVPVMWVLVFLIWIPFRAGDMAATVQAFQALGAGGWTSPSLGFLVGALGIVAADLLRVPLPADYPAYLQAPPPRPPRLASASAWLAACVAVAVLTSVLWNAEQRTFIYFQF
jgi:alginate O-acetyltransferase complex protein AlgI